MPVRVTTPTVRDAVPVPTWDQFIHIIPQALQNPYDRRAARRNDAIRIQNTQIPQWHQDLSKIHVYLDNIEDGLTTAALAGRLALRWVPRLSPVVGAILVADTVVGAAVALIRLASAGLPAVPGAVINSALSLAGGNGPRGMKKTTALARITGHPWRTLKQAYKGATPLTHLPTWGEWLEIAQTTDNLFGIGLQLGPLYGTLEEIQYRGIQAGVTAARDGYVLPGQRDAYDALNHLAKDAGLPTAQQYLAGQLSPTVKAAIDAALSTPIVQTSLRALEATFGIAQPKNGLSPEQNLGVLETAANSAAALADAQKNGININLLPYGSILKDVPLPPTRKTPPETIAAQVSAGLDPHGPLRWPIEGADALLTYADIAPTATTNARAWLAELADAWRGTDVADYVGQLAAAFVDSTIDLITAGEPRQPDIPQAGYRIVAETIFRGLALTEPTPDANLERWLNQLGGNTHQADPLHLPTRDILAAAKATGVPLAPLDRELAPV